MPITIRTTGDHRPTSLINPTCWLARPPDITSITAPGITGHQRRVTSCQERAARTSSTGFTASPGQDSRK